MEKHTRLVVHEKVSIAIGRAIAEPPILNTTITLERLRKRGNESKEVYYQKVSPMFNSLSRFWAGNRCI